MDNTRSTRPLVATKFASQFFVRPSPWDEEGINEPKVVLALRLRDGQATLFKSLLRYQHKLWKNL
jgi:hypothetical protein